MDLTTDSFVALAAVGWADGRMSRGEAEGLLRAAEQCGLSGEELVAVKRATGEQVSLEDFDPGGMSDRQRLLTYAVASWLARVDGVTQATEQASLQTLGERLGLTEFKQKAAASAAFDVAMAPGGHRPDKYDFGALAETLRGRLPAVEG